MKEFDRLSPDNKVTYQGFLGITKWALLFIVIVLIGMAVFLV